MADKDNVKLIEYNKISETRNRGHDSVSQRSLCETHK